MSTDFLFTQPSFVSGIASIANLQGKILCNASATSCDADAIALASDWSIIGQDVQEAINNYEK